MSESSTKAKGFDDLVEANKRYAETEFTIGGFDGIAHAVSPSSPAWTRASTRCACVGLNPGDAKIFRNPGGRVTSNALEALVLGVHLLGVERILIVPHTRCAMATNSEQELRARVGESAGQDASWQGFHVVTDQRAALGADVAAVRSHPLIPDSVSVGGFLYDVDSGLLDQLF